MQWRNKGIGSFDEIKKNQSTGTGRTAGVAKRSSRSSGGINSGISSSSGNAKARAFDPS